MPQKMKAVVKTKPQLGAEWLEVNVPELKPDWVMVKVRATSICGTDVHIYEWNKWADERIGSKNLPQILGHEVAGEVVEVGPHCKRIKAGDYISAETHIYDPGDLQAMLGQFHIGERMKIVGVDHDGCFAEYFALPESVCWVNDKSIPPELATVQEPMGNACYTLLGENSDVAGKSVAIFGDGPTALFAAGLARASGLTQIFVIGMSDFALNIAKKMGADHTLNISDKSVNRLEFIRDHTGGYGTDIVLDMVGAPAAIEEGLKVIRKGGRYSAFGVPPTTPVPVDYTNGIVFRGITINGISGRKMFDTWYRVKNFLASGRIDIKPIVTHLFELKDFAKGFEAAMGNPRQCGKAILFPDPKELEAARKRMGIK
ncbi:MAG: alcohol dehydrogenase catalytic domain-containing protein [Candidatus Edwardsbacteria bacterium]|nr:alcohol dehydrogenase catalytic domain-containing protein [Candidatus Edwardsbacteria bacterium]MBU1575990.1 alcohol dehydrogenase catalytic domain-containing protein [Candidatus Edwardsbacteria bacterium]MBU2463443.1 alcohol dehydrogenase catalytic domain-containing protein [Candidatus Edwardsbacteria bacterium]MBU2595057.1 alcohol dehydrogenase catalytic domain-containing protein [Candidatus Edwardsbacteria bacterium]